MTEPNTHPDFPECKCQYGLVSEEDEALVRRYLKPGDDLEKELEEHAYRNLHTRTGHNWGCPVDVSTYAPGEFYCHCDTKWANSFLSQQSNRMLVIGPLNADSPDFLQFRDASGVTGLYREQ